MYCTRHTPVYLYSWFLQVRYLKQISVDEVIVTHTLSSTVIQSVAHATSAVIVTNQVPTDRVGFAVETTDTTFVYVCNDTSYCTCSVVRLLSHAVRMNIHCGDCLPRHSWASSSHVNPLPKNDVQSHEVLK